MKPLIYLIILTSSLFTISCSSDKNKSQSETVAEKNEPTQAAAVIVLKEFATNIENKDFTAAGNLMKLPPEVTAEELIEHLVTMEDRREISSSGVTKLIEKGKYGKLTEIFPKRGIRFAEKSGVDSEDCFALGSDPAEVGFYWDGNKFFIIRCDDVGKL